MSKHEDSVTAAKVLLQAVGASFSRVAGSMRETSSRLNATLTRIKATHKLA